MSTPHDRPGRPEDSPPITTYHATWDADCEDELPTTVVNAVADAMGADVTDLDPLSRRLDPDALDHLFDPQSGSGRSDCYVGFRFNGHDVTVYADGHVVVTDASPAPHSR